MPVDRRRWKEYGIPPPIWKRNYLDKLISRIMIDEAFLTDPQDILNEERSFYNKLYSLPTMPSYQNTATSDKHFFLENNRLRQLNETDKARCENGITERELLISIKAMKNNRHLIIGGLWKGLRWDYILSSLKAFNFGPTLIGYIKRLNNDLYTVIINNGCISTWFQLRIS